MHVGFVIAGDVESGSGGFYYDRRLRDRLCERGHEVTIVSLRRESYSQQLLDNIRYTTRTLSNHTFDIVLEDGLAHPSLLRANRGLDVPIVALVHMVRTRTADRRYRPLVRSVERRFLTGVDAAIYNSEASKRSIEALFTPGSTTIVPPGGDRFATTMSPPAIRRKAALEPLSIGFVGNVIERKGLDTVVDALANLDTDWRLTIIGDTEVDPAYVASVRKQIRTHCLVDRITFTGRLPDSAVRSRLRRFHVLAVPSIYEPFGMAHLESMGFGCVPIASTNGGASEFIEDGVSGFVVPPDDPDAIADRLVRMTDRSARAELAVAARNAFERQPGWDECMDLAVDFLEQQCHT